MEKMVNSVQTYTVDSPAAMEYLAARLGSKLRGGEVIELISDLGGGKTTFVRGLAQGLGSTDHVSSPTFKLANEYSGTKLKLVHFDFYRLPEAGIVGEELAEVLDDPLTVIALEWADPVQNILPATRLQIDIKPLGETKRLVTVHLTDQLSYCLVGLSI